MTVATTSPDGSIAATDGAHAHVWEQCYDRDER